MFAEKSSVLLLLLRLHTTQFQCPALPTSNSKKAKVWEWKRKLGVTSRKDQNIVQEQVWNLTDRTKHLVLYTLPNSLCPTTLPSKWKTWNSERQCTPIPPILQQTSGYNLFQKNFLMSTLKGLSSLQSWLLCVLLTCICVHIHAQVLRRKSGKCELKRENPEFCSTFLPLSLGTRLYKIILLISITRFYAASQFAWFPRR